jgi:hypothetical protein
LLLHYIIVQSFVTIGHLEFKLLSTFTMNFSLLKPNVAKYFTSETKYSIAITADDSVTKKFPVLKDGPLEVTLFWHTQFDELTQLKNFDAANKQVYEYSTPPQWRCQGLSGWINAHNDVMPNNEKPTEAHFCAVWTAFIINYGASNKTTKGLRDFI